MGSVKSLQDKDFFALYFFFVIVTGYMKNFNKKKLNRHKASSKF